MKKLWDFLFSTRVMGVLFIVFAAAMAVATFIENDYGTPTARKLIYNAWWFELIMALFVLNFAGNIFRYRLWRREKWSVLLFHLAFLFILIGAWVTRYISYEGIMPIPEGVTENKFLSEKVYLSVSDTDGKSLIVKPLLLGKLGNNHFTAKSDDGSLVASFEKYIPHAKQSLQASKDGPLRLHLVESSTGSRQDHYIALDSIIETGGVKIGFGAPSGKTDITIAPSGDSLLITSTMQGEYMVMRSRQSGNVLPDSTQKFNLRALYTFGPVRFVVPEPPTQGNLTYTEGPKNAYPDDLLVINLSEGGTTRKVRVKGGQYTAAKGTPVELNGKKYYVAYGSRYITLPFSIRLRDFQLERYPGSNSPKSYASEITVIDKEKGKNFDFRIYMNHILNYRGYKFFQSSYSITPQGEETRLSVNHDAAGTTLTYFGYALLFAGLLLSLFLPGTRFSYLRRRLRQLQSAASIFFILILFIPSAKAQSGAADINIDTFLRQMAPPKHHAEIFGSAIVQDAGGRMKPVNTFSSQLLRKLSKHDTYHGYNADQILLSMIISPRVWYYAPIIYIERNDTGIRGLLGVSKNQKYARLVDFFDENGAYKLAQQVDEASKKRIKNTFEKNIIAIDERANLLYSVLEMGAGQRLFPKPGDPNHKWYSPLQANQFSGADSLYVSNIFPLYGRIIAEGNSNDSMAVSMLNSLHKFQSTYGGYLMPDEKKVKLEILYNKYDIFKKLFAYYMLAGTLLFLLVMFRLFKDGVIIRRLIHLNVAVIGFLFALHTAGLLVRWYVSGHAPWSNAYESMIYVAWALMLMGLIFGRRSALTVGASAFLTSMILMIAHWNWMDPAIENLVPVLNSYWLMIHVSLIVASYGPFALSMILGLVALLFMILANERNREQLELKIKEITVINEMSMTVGLVLLTIGNFLGGMWANESWGRYWGWDPKETWALISIMVYAFILHARLIPGLRGRYIFNLLSVIGFSSILMTYFGVNFYLAGLHSYAKGDPVPTPMWVYYAIAMIAILAVFAYFGYKKHFQKSTVRP